MNSSSQKSIERKPTAIAAIDLLSYDASHLTINHFWIDATPGNAEISVFGEAEHVRALERKCKKFKSNYFRKNKFWRIKREFYFILSLIKTRKSHRRLILGATGGQHLTLSILEKIFRRHFRKTTVIFHSELEGLVDGPGLSKKLSKIAITILGYPKNIKGVLLGRHISENINELGIERNFCCIEHPLPDLKFTATVPVGTPKFEISSIGLLRTDTKDFQQANDIGKGNGVRVRLIGRKGPRFFQPENVDVTQVEQHFSEEWMQSQLTTTHGILACPRRSSYGFTASGTATDSLLYGKYLVYLHHPALKRYDDAPFSLNAPDTQSLVKKIEIRQELDESEVQDWIARENKASAELFLQALNLKQS